MMNGFQQIVNRSDRGRGRFAPTGPSLFVAALSVAVYSTSGCSAAPASDRRAAEQELVAIERELSTAFLHKDSKRLAAQLADDYVVTYGNGSIADKATELANLADTTETIETSSLDEFVVHDYGAFAVVNFRVTATGVRMGKPLNAQFRYTDVFARRQGRWLCVASHNTHIGEPAL